MADWTFHVATGLTAWSPGIYRLLKLRHQPASMTFEDFLLLYPPADSERLKTSLRHAIRSNRSYELEMDYRSLPGERARHRCLMIPVVDTDGQVTDIHGCLQDISDITRIEAIPENRLVSVRFVGMNTRDVLFRFALPEGTCDFISPAVSEVTGRDPSEWYRNPFFISEILHPDWLGRFRKEFEKVLNGISPNEYVFPILHISGETRWIHLRTTILRECRGEIVAVEGIASDITERKRAEEERKQLIRDLKKALSQVKKLSGLLPICSHCKKVRDDRGYWKQIEAFISERSDLFFTHGLCPECLVRHYPEYAGKRLSGT
jgi:PAS domain S-box-containing protein